MKKPAVITTTISSYDWIESWPLETRFYIALDGKSKPNPPRRPETEWISRERCLSLAALYGLEGVIPEGGASWRTFALIRALEDGAETIISVDDDNFPGRFWEAEHLTALGSRTLTVVYPRRGKFLNPLGPTITQRGFPVRTNPPDQLEFYRASRPIALNMGLWTGTPDVDAFWHLTGKALEYPIPEETFGVYPDVYIPVNSQNTAMTRTAAMTYFDLPTSDIPGLERYNDILTGYFTEKIIKHLGWDVAFGPPIVDHHRNPHDPLVDLKKETYGYELITWLKDFILHYPLSGTDPISAYGSLIDGLEETSGHLPGIKTLTQRMRKWNTAMTFL